MKEAKGPRQREEIITPLPLYEAIERDEKRSLPLLLLPGTVCDERLFAPLLGLLKHPDARVVDMSGERTARDLAARILSEAPAAFNLLGFSLGGIVALEMMAQAPERIAGLALIDTTPRPDPRDNAKARRAAVAKARAEGMDGYILDAWAQLVSPANAQDLLLRETIIAMARDAGPETLATQSEVAISRADSRQRLGTIVAPTVVLAGADENVCPLKAHEELARGIAGARYFIIPRAGHFAPLENPAAVTGHIDDWLLSTGSFRPRKATVPIS